MKMCTNALRGVLSFAIRFPLGMQAQAGNFSRIQILIRTRFSLSIAAAALLLTLIASPGTLAAQNIVSGGLTGTVTDVIRAGVGSLHRPLQVQFLDNFTTNFPQVTNFNLPSGAVAFNENGSGASLLAGCNTAFQSSYNSGGTVGTFLNAAPAGCTVPTLQNTANRTLNPKYVEWNLEIQTYPWHQDRCFSQLRR